MPFPIAAPTVLAACLAAAWPSIAAAAAPAAPDFASRCAGCHSTQAGANKIGPSLDGVYGRTSGTEPGYSYSSALKGKKLVWNDQNLDKFLQNPSGLVPGTKMFVSVPDAAARQHIIAYLKTLQPQSAAGK